MNVIASDIAHTTNNASARTLHILAHAHDEDMRAHDPGRVRSSGRRCREKEAAWLPKRRFLDFWIQQIGSFIQLTSSWPRICGSGAGHGRHCGPGCGNRGPTSSRSVSAPHRETRPSGSPLGTGKPNHGKSSKRSFCRPRCHPWLLVSRCTCTPPCLASLWRPETPRWRIAILTPGSSVIAGIQRDVYEVSSLTPTLNMVDSYEFWRMAESSASSGSFVSITR